MTCKEIAALTPAHLSGELEPELRVDFEEHVARCQSCAHELEQLAGADARLREALNQPLPDASAIQRRVRGRIVSEARRRWAMAAAAAVILAISGYALLTSNRVLREAALDHRLEVGLHQPRRWRTGEAEVAKLAARYSLTDPSALAPAGFHLEKAKMCGLAGKPALHLVFTDGTREVSVFVRDVKNRQSVSESEAGGEHLASFADGRLQIVVASDSQAECAEFARNAARVKL
jgi:anti-sigma factor RsiW